MWLRKVDKYFTLHDIGEADKVMLAFWKVMLSFGFK